VPVSVPNVVGQPIDTANSILAGLLFKVTTTYVDAPDPKNTVIAQTPGANQSAGKGSVVALTVSNGPKTSTVPDVTSQDAGAAQQAIEGSGFKSRVVFEDVFDPNAEGIVQRQSPEGGTQAKPGTVVTINVGRYNGGGDTTTDTTTTP
jgi:serine/threonine-protein kinase